MKKYNVLIVEDEPIIAEDIKECLEDIGFQVSAIAHDGKSALLALEKKRPSIAILDIHLNGRMNGIEVAHHINKYYQLPFVFLTSYADKKTLEHAKKTLPMGYVVKPFDSKDLLSALEIALFNFQNMQSLPENKLSIHTLNQKIYTPLTEREFEVLLLLLQGKTNKQIAGELFVSTNTIKTHLSNIYDKFDVDSRAKVLAFVSNVLQKAS